MVPKPYTKLSEALPSPIFTLSDAQKRLRSTSGSTKVILSRLKQGGQVISLERGRYRLISPESHAKLQELKQKNLKFYRLALEIYRNYPRLEMLVLYGSQVTGGADKFSDYDVLVVIKELLEKEEKERFKQELERKLGIKLHLTIWSERSYRTFLLTEPHLKFWLSEAIVLDEADLFGPLPPTAKYGYSEALRLAEVHFETANGSPREANHYLIALKIALMLDRAMRLDYSFKSVKEEIEKLVGKDLFSSIRKNSLSPIKVHKKHIENLRRITREKFREVRMKLESIGRNESDLFLESKLKKVGA